jgi:hypothetical protein
VNREYLEYRVQPPIIPLQEVILRDLFFIEENPNLDPERESWVNFDKMAMLGKGTRVMIMFFPYLGNTLCLDFLKIVFMKIGVGSAVVLVASIYNDY